MTEPDFLRATRSSYDTVAADYAARFRAELTGKPLERAMLTAFAELVRAGGGGPVADVGCGPGRVTALLHGLGLDVFGIDLSPAMVAVARRDHPHLRFEEGSMTALDLPDASLAGLVALYSVIHVPDEALPGVFAGFHRVLAPGGHLLLVFQAGDERTHHAELFGHRVDLHLHRRRADRVAALLTGAGLEVRARLEREPHDDGAEKVGRVHLLARRPAGTARPYGGGAR
ncbi:class I SAM-dependent DNA methyltransferase [Kitasatospora sp. NPDC004240]